MEQRVDEDGKNEGPAVMVGIEVEPIGNITSRESGQTSIWSLSTRELGYQAKGAKQMTGETKATAPRTRATATPGAAPHTPTDWAAIHWRPNRSTIGCHAYCWLWLCSRQGLGRTDTRRGCSARSRPAVAMRPAGRWKGSVSDGTCQRPGLWRVMNLS